MTKFLPPFVLGLLLCSCATTKPVSDDLVAKVRNGIIATCGYKADIGTLAQLINTFIPGFSLLDLVVNTVCAAIAPLTPGTGTAGPRPKGATVVVNGVKLPVDRKHFVK